MRKLLFVAAALLPAVTFAQGASGVTVPVDMTSLVTSLGTELGSIIAVVAGLALGFVAVRKALRWVRGLVG